MIKFTDEFEDELEQMEWEAELSEIIHEGMKEQTETDEIFREIYAKRILGSFDDEM